MKKEVLIGRRRGHAAVGGRYHEYEAVVTACRSGKEEEGDIVVLARPVPAAPHGNLGNQESMRVASRAEEGIFFGLEGHRDRRPKRSWKGRRRRQAKQVFATCFKQL